MRTTVLILVGACVALSGTSFAHEAHEHGSDQSHSSVFGAGEPGDPKKPARIVQITMFEKEGKMLFAPERLEIKKGDQVKFVLRNGGELEHEFVLATTAENLEHAEAMRKNPDMAHDESNGKTVKPKQSGELIWRFTKSGEFEYACLIPGHREAGMIGGLVVK